MSFFIIVAAAQNNKEGKVRVREMNGNWQESVDRQSLLLVFSLSS